MNNFPSIVIVGKGPSLLEKELGEKIDSFDIVIRVNHIPVDCNLQKHIGTKTTIFSSCSQDKITHFLDSIKKMWISNSYDTWIGVSPSIQKEHIQLLDVIRDKKIDVTFMSKDEEHLLVKEFGGFGELYTPKDIKLGICIPDTGITTIFTVIQRFENSQIYVCGFDLYLNGTKSIFGTQKLSSIYADPVTKQLLYYKKMLYSKKIHEL